MAPADAFSAPRFDPDMTSLAIANTRQSVIKHLLTEADRIAVGRLCKLEEQGGYAVAMNYGASSARSPDADLTSLRLSGGEDHLPALGKRHFSCTSHRLSRPSRLSPFVNRNSSILTSAAAGSGLLASAAAGHIADSPTAAIPPHLRTSHAANIPDGVYPSLELNGILEAFHAASATPQQVKTQAKWMIGSSAVFVACLAVLSAGSSGCRRSKCLYGLPAPPW